MKVRTAGLGIALVAVGALLGPAAAGAATITVDDLADPGAPGGTCTLREAIASANGDATVGDALGCANGRGADAIGFTAAVTPKVLLTSALPAISTEMTITGPGAAALDVERQSGGNYRIFGVSGDVPVTISGLTISGGNTVQTSGPPARAAGVWNSGGDLTLSGVVVEDNNVADTRTGDNSAQPLGGGVASELNTSSLVISDSVIRNNIVTASATNTGTTAADDAMSVISGAGVYSNSPSTAIERTTISGNTATATATVTAATATPKVFLNGVGVRFDGTGGSTATLTASTVGGNTGSAAATGGTDAVASSLGAIYGPADPVVLDRVTVTDNSVTGLFENGGMFLNGPATITSSTIAGNDAAGVANLTAPAGATIKNTIVADPLGGGANCSGSVPLAAVENHNLEFPGTGCGFTGTGDIQTEDPLLDPLGLQPNGGPTDTIALQSGSPTIDAGLSAGETADQRGIARPSDLAAVPNVADGSDIGAFEVACTVASALAGCPAPPVSSPPPPAAIGLRAAALKKCKKKKSKKAGKKCKKRALELPV